ncbi:hypothetical protein GCM10011390_00440 [Aureimonas endophytica]|uniref:Chromosome partitioning protein n=1 Tax=Aureimonas endophytica TaxID=2027858 RepID=A0A916ZB96_9HYPH|nr:hypothetical protein GCM10011390_00440 [Aureimonas endophytica]
MTLASAAAAAGLPVMLIDGAPDKDLVAWSNKIGQPARIEVAYCEKPVRLESLVQEGIDRRALVVIDAGRTLDMLRTGARLADTVLVPVRFSPLSAFAAAATDQFLTSGNRSNSTRHAFVATAVTQIPSRIARAVEMHLDSRPTERLPIGLSQRAAYEAPFMYGGTIFTLDEEEAPGLLKAQEEAIALATELDALQSAGAKLAQRTAQAVSIDRRFAA